MNDLSDAFIRAMKEKPDITIDEFFSMNNIPKKSRNDFVLAAILRQTKEKTK